jgi:hypothetical protein
MANDCRGWPTPVSSNLVATADQRVLAIRRPVLLSRMPAEKRHRLADRNFPEWLNLTAAQLVHGRGTRKRRFERSLGLARLAALEALGRSLGLISGPLTRGPKPGSR